MNTFPPTLSNVRSSKSTSLGAKHHQRNVFCYGIIKCVKHTGRRIVPLDLCGKLEQIAPHNLFNSCRAVPLEDERLNRAAHHLLWWRNRWQSGTTSAMLAGPLSTHDKVPRLLRLWPRCCRTMLPLTIGFLRNWCWVNPNNVDPVAVGSPHGPRADACEIAVTLPASTCPSMPSTGPSEDARTIDPSEEGPATRRRRRVLAQR